MVVMRSATCGEMVILISCYKIYLYLGSTMHERGGDEESVLSLSGVVQKSSSFHTLLPRNNDAFLKESIVSLTLSLCETRVVISEVTHV
jgi:hypothetical protein